LEKEGSSSPESRIAECCEPELKRAPKAQNRKHGKKPCRKHGKGKSRKASVEKGERANEP
jgi:hypothetical protein